MSQPAQRYRYAIDFQIDGDIRFVAHKDVVRILSRSCVRANLPVAFTAGFNPRVRLSLPFPRPVGQASDVERALVQLTEELTEAAVGEALREHLPEGIRVRRVIRIEGTRPGQAEWVRYRISTAPADREKYTRAASRLLGSSSFEITRVRHKDGKSRVVNIRPFIDAIDVREDAIDVATYIQANSSATPSEVCRALGMEADRIDHLVRRVEIRWQDSPPSQVTPL